MKKLTFLALPLLLLSGCADKSDDTTGSSSGPSEDTAQAAFEYVQQGLKDGNPAVVWDSLPASYQKDVNDVVHLFAQNMDAEVWGQVTKLLGTLQGIFETKADFFAGHPMLAANAESVKAGIPKVAGLFKTVLDSAGDLEKLKTFDGGDFLRTTGKDVMSQFQAITALSPTPTQSTPLDNFVGTTVETVESTDTSATLQITEASGKVSTENFIKVEGKWIPLRMAEDWEKQMKEAREGLAELPKKMQEQKGQVELFAGLIGGALSPIENADSQEAFNNALNGLQQNAMAMMMGGGMGMGGPPVATPPADTPPPEEPASLGDVPEEAGK